MNQSYIYAALLLHEEGKEINQTNIQEVLQSVDIDISKSKVKALIAALENVDIENALRGDFSPPTSPREQVDSEIKNVSSDDNTGKEGEETDDTPELEEPSSDENETPELDSAHPDDKFETPELESGNEDAQSDEEAEGIDDLFGDNN